MGDTLSPKFDNLQIIDDDLFARCQEVVKGRATILKKDMSIPYNGPHVKTTSKKIMVNRRRDQWTQAALKSSSAKVP